MDEIEQFSEATFDSEWLLVNAVRQTFGIANKTTITYAQAVGLAKELAPQLLRENSPILKAFDADVIKLFRERAEAQSRIENRTILPIHVLDAEISRLESELQKAEIGKSPSIENEIRRLKKTRPRLDETGWTETQAINCDADVPEIGLAIVGKGQGYKEYYVSTNRRLRVRVLHPDPPEARSGVDLIYENYYERKKDKQKPVLLVRIAALQ